MALTIALLLAAIMFGALGLCLLTDWLAGQPTGWPTLAAITVGAVLGSLGGIHCHRQAHKR